MSEPTIDMKPFMDAVKAAYREAGAVYTPTDLVDRTLEMYTRIICAHVQKTEQPGIKLSFPPGMGL